MPARRLPATVRALRGLDAVDPPVLGPGLGDTQPPAWLPEEGQREWSRIIAACRAHPGWLQEVDRALLTAYASTWATYVVAARNVAERGPLVPGRSSADAARGDGAGPALVRNPAVAIARDAATQLRALAEQLGFSPSARMKVALGKQDSSAGSDLLTGG